MMHEIEVQVGKLQVFQGLLEGTLNISARVASVPDFGGDKQLVAWDFWIRTTRVFGKDRAKLGLILVHRRTVNVAITSVYEGTTQQATTA